MTEAAGAPSVYVDADPFVYFTEGEEAIENLLREIA
jgi:hypothetical protein